MKNRELAALYDVAAFLNSSTATEPLCGIVLDKLATLEGDSLYGDDDQVIVPAIAIEDLATDAFRAIARDGASTVEVAVRLQKTLTAWARLAPAFANAARDQSMDALRRAEEALSTEADRDAVRRAASALTGG